MIDFHAHIIPNVDDGSRSVEETFEIIKEAKEAGFDSIIATSHYIKNRYESNVEERNIWIDALQENLNRQKFDFKLYLGNEIYFSDNIINYLEDGEAISMNFTSYVLFEFSLRTKPSNMYDVIYDMIGAKIVPILAHPERYEFVQKDPDMIYDLIQAGVLMQANYGSILGMYGEKAEIIVKKLLENNMIHFLGSDVHRPKTIYPRVQEALSHIRSIVGENKIKELTEINPKLVLDNKRIDIDEPKKFKLSLKEKMQINLKK